MSQNRTTGNRNNNDNGGGWNTATVVGGVLGGIAALAGGYYLYSSGSRDKAQPSSNNDRRSGNVERVARNSRAQTNQPSSRSGSSEGEQGETWSSYVTGLLHRMDSGASSGNGNGSCRRGVPRSSVPDNPTITNIDSLLHDIYLRYIALNDEDFEIYYGVVHNIFLQMHTAMKEVDPYYNKYSSTIQFAGSHPDRLRINKPDEFDIDIVIALPLSFKSNPNNPAESDFLIEPKDPGFVQLKMGVQYARLPQRDLNEWQINRAAYEWKDDRSYLQRSKFMDWFKSVVNRALNNFVDGRTGIPTFRVDGVQYTVRKSESGPAMTMYIENLQKNFKLDVDLVPALRFPIERWPPCNSYRNVPPVCVGKDYWMVVPKPNKSGATEHDRNRSWRVALHEQERDLMHNTNNMRQAIRLIKKLRDAQKMNKIASYYIKTMFFWEVIKHQTDREFWKQSPATLLKIMLKNFHSYLVDGRIPYFWNKNNNLIGSVDRATLDRYATTVSSVLTILDQPWQYKQIAKYLLTPAEFREYNQRFLHI